jgi:hypothetical protein
VFFLNSLGFSSLCKKIKPPHKNVTDILKTKTKTLKENYPWFPSHMYLIVYSSCNSTFIRRAHHQEPLLWSTKNQPNSPPKRRAADAQQANPIAAPVHIQPRRTHQNDDHQSRKKTMQIRSA